MRPALAVLLVLTIPLTASGATLQVPSQYPTIQSGIDAAVTGDTVLVAPGAYVELIDFKGKAITVKSQKGAVVTVIDGNSAGTVVTCQTGEGPNSVLDGFTITNGSGLEGGGMRNSFSSPTVTRCVFLDNRAMGSGASCYGAGMYNESASPTVTDCAFTGNQAISDAGSSGGGMHNNASSPTVTKCSFTENKAVGSIPAYGGGMANSSSYPIMTDCIFSGNVSDFEGGGMQNNLGILTMTNCVFSENSASQKGGGMNCVFGKVTLTNCTFSANTANEGGGLSGYLWSNMIVVNSIFWGNSASVGSEFWVGDQSWTSSLTISYSDIRGGKSSIFVDKGCSVYWGSGMIKSDPLFLNPMIEDFHLTHASPCKDTGDNFATTGLFDFEGDPRIAGGTVDLGVDEFHKHLYQTGSATPGGTIQVKFVGNPGTTQVALVIGMVVLDPAISGPYGDWFIANPYIFLPVLGLIPASGIYVLSGLLPATIPGPYSVYLQAIIDYELSNVCEMMVE